MRIDIITIFPEIIRPYLDESILKRAQEKKLVRFFLHNLRDFTRDAHKKVDDKPYGGGPGMVLMVEPILRAVDSIKKLNRRKIIILSAKGKPFNQKIAYNLSKKNDQLILISGRYEGIDERVKKALRAQDLSIGPYVLTDGDVAAMVISSAVVRLTPGVIKLESLAEESHWNLLVKKKSVASQREGLEYSHYTRPEVFAWQGKKYRVPKVLLSGNHKKIEEWRIKHVQPRKTL